MLLFGVVLTVSSLLPWPHAVGSESGVDGPVATVNVTGGMWYWQIDRDSSRWVCQWCSTPTLLM
ncbi:MAG: hypothetical protein IPM70_13910 [Proteobacteria bacterium]|nr:hypothetical protein [Pseudomonadota bacterium]